MNTNPPSNCALISSPEKITPNITPNTDSRLKIKDALEDDVYFCPTFCNSNDNAVQITAKYKIPPTTAGSAFIWIGLSTVKVSIQAKIAANPNCKIVIKIGSKSFPNLSTETICAANNTALSKANPSPSDNEIPSVKVARHIPTTHKMAAITL